ncbi:MAG: M48 family metallopeptidase [Gammaproteobacteria bacterium]
MTLRYENRKIPDDINKNKDHPLKEFLWLGIGLLLVGALVVVFSGWAGQTLARFIPFSYEQEMAERFADDLDESEHPDIEAYLQAMADEISVAINLPDEMRITAHYVDSEVVNAFATIGGHIMIFRGLIEESPSENALAMVVGHEIAHIKHRDPIVALSRGVMSLVALQLLTGSSGNEIVARLMGDAGLLSSMHFSRQQESAADVDGLAAVMKRYGHTEGASSIFEVFLQAEASDELSLPAMFQSHPASRKRLDAMSQQAEKNQWPQTGDLTPLPEIFQ